MVSIQTIDEVQTAIRVFPQQGADIKKSQGLHPEIIGRKIEYPWIDEKNVLRRGHLFWCGAEGGTRTHTAVKDHKLLRLTRLPIPPLPHSMELCKLGRIAIIISYSKKVKTRLKSILDTFAHQEGLTNQDSVLILKTE
jgi:hypothetical protein